MPGILILVIVVFAVAYGLAIWQISKSIRARKWPTVEGRVVDARVKVSTSADEYHDHTSYDIVINYRYVVDGNEYTREVQAAFFSTPGEAENQLASYPPGMPVEVFYNPKRPKDSMLEAGKHFGCNVGLLVFLLLLLLPPLVLGIFYLIDIL